MSIKSFLTKLAAALAPLLLMAALSAAPADAAGSTVVVATTPNPTNCGKFKIAQSTDLAAALNAAKKGKVLICPGTYHLVGDVVISGASRLTVAQAVTVKGVDTRPHIVVDPSTTTGLSIQGSSNVTLKGLFLDGSQDMRIEYVSVRFAHSSGKVMNSSLLNFFNADRGIVADNSGARAYLSVAVSNTSVVGFQQNGILANGPVRLTVTSSLVDPISVPGVAAPGAWGIVLGGEGQAKIATGTVSRSTVRNASVGIYLFGTSRVSISRNTLADNQSAVVVFSAEGFPLATGNKVTGNTITGVPSNGSGVYVTHDDDPATAPFLNTKVSGNVIRAAQPGGAALGILFTSSFPAAKTMTGTVTANTLIGFLPGSAIINTDGNAGVKIAGNHVKPN